MDKRIMNYSRFEKILFGIFACIIFVVVVVNMQKHIGPIVVPDEIGYWSTGNFFAGKNWNGIMKDSSYYGWGYGLILAPICFLFSGHPVFSFRMAIILNALFLVLVFYLIYKILVQLFHKLDIHLAMLISFVVTLYSGNIYYSNTTYCETALLLFFVLSIYMLIRVLIHASYLNLQILLFFHHLL